VGFGLLGFWVFFLIEGFWVFVGRSVATVGIDNGIRMNRWKPSACEWKRKEESILE
jgi:hypothetical protein